MKKTILLTGASGAVGSEALKELVRRKEAYHIRVFDVKTEAAEKLFQSYGGDIEIIWGDVTDYGSVEKAVAGVDFVIHLAAIIPPLADREVELAERVNFGGTKNIIKAMEALSPKAFLLFSSSISVYGDRVESPWIEVDDPLVPSVGDYYAETKIKSEAAVRNSKLDWTIFRFTGIFGTGKGQTKMDPLFFHMPLDTCLEIATTRDTGYALVQAIDHRSDLNKKTFNLAGGEHCRTTYRAFIEKSFEIVGLNFSKLPEKAFADQNFHCGYLKDAGELEDILHFQRDTLEDYYDNARKNTGLLKKSLARLFSSRAMKDMLDQSDPLNALKENDKELIIRFYKNGKPRV